MATKTNSGLVEYAKAQVGLPYWWGTYGQTASASLYNKKKEQYPDNYTANDFTSQYGKRVHDCSGLPKGYLMSESATATPVYNSKYDLSASGFYTQATTKGKISTFPKTNGLLVFRGTSASSITHVGIYSSDGYVYEAKNHANGVVKTAYKASDWNFWAQCHFITDDSAEVEADPDGIWEFLLEKIGNAFGVAGAMANLFAESGLIPNNLQNSFNTKLGMTDAEYTAAVDNGTYTKFSSDSAGYGLAQWTYSSRKKNLKTYADGESVSIGDQTMQLEFFVKELKESYASVWKILCNATSVKEASDAVLTGYEKPADQSDSVKEKRTAYGQAYYDTYAGASFGTSVAAKTSTTTSKPSYTTGKTYTLQVDKLNVRKGPGKGYAKVTYANLTSDAKKHAYSNGQLKKGTNVTCKGTSNDGDDIWMQIPSGYIAAYYDNEIYVK